MHPERRLPERRDRFPRPAPFRPGILPRLDLLADRRRGVARLGKGDLGGGTEAEVAPPAVCLDPQDPLAGAVLADDQHQPLPVAVPARLLQVADLHRRQLAHAPPPILGCGIRPTLTSHIFSRLGANVNGRWRTRETSKFKLVIWLTERRRIAANIVSTDAPSAIFYGTNILQSRISP